MFTGAYILTPQQTGCVGTKVNFLMVGKFRTFKRLLMISVTAFIMFHDWYKRTQGPRNISVTRKNIEPLFSNVFLPSSSMHLSSLSKCQLFMVSETHKSLFFLFLSRSSPKCPLVKQTRFWDILFFSLYGISNSALHSDELILLATDDMFCYFSGDSILLDTEIYTVLHLCGILSIIAKISCFLHFFAVLMMCG